MNRSVVIEFKTNGPKVLVNEFEIVTAPTVEELYAVLGKPTRVDSGEIPAPAGHRNNQIHVYDSLGLYFNEHHYTGRVQELCCSFEVEEPAFRFTPYHAFLGKLVFNDTAIPLGGPVVWFFRHCPLPLVERFGGARTFELDGFYIWVATRGHRLPSGRRSKSRRVTYISFSWPHDDWGEPVRIS